MKANNSQELFIQRKKIINYSQNYQSTFYVTTIYYLWTPNLLSSPFIITVKTFNPMVTANVYLSEKIENPMSAEEADVQACEIEGQDTVKKGPILGPKDFQFFLKILIKKQEQKSFEQIRVAQFVI